MPPWAPRSRSIKPNDISVSEISRWEELEAVRDEWNELLASGLGDTPFLRHEWLENWWRHFGAGRRLAVLLARREGRLLAALPLMEQRERLHGIPVTTLRSITNRHSYRYNALCAPGGEAGLEAIWGHLAGRARPWHALILEEIPADASLLDPLLRAAERARAPVGVWRGGEVPFLTIEGTWEQYHAALSQKFRANLRRRRNQLRENGEVSYRCVAAPGDVSEALRAGLKLEGSGWKDQAGSSIVSDPTLVSFYETWAKIAAANDWLRLSFLDVGGVPAAFDYSTHYHGRTYNMKIGYDPAWERFSVGQLLKEDILRHCFEREVREYDFLGISTVSKEDWKPKKRAHDWHFVYAPTLLGRLLHFVKFTVVPALKRRGTR